MLTCRDVFTGGLYGFLATIAKTIRETDATHMVICQDRKPYLRSLAYPEYKQIRKKSMDEELLKRHKQSMTLVLELLEALNYPVWGLDGFESDDLSVFAAAKYRHRFQTIYIATNDSDVYQALWIPNLYIFKTGIADVVNGGHLLHKHGLTPEEYMLTTALTGTHNDVEGIPKVGPVTAKKAVKDPALLRAYRASHGEIIDRNLSLIQLPHPQFPRDACIPKYEGPFDHRKFARLLARYQIDATVSMVNAFEQLDPK